MMGFKRKLKNQAPSIGGVIVTLHHEHLAPETDQYIKFKDVGVKYSAESLCWHAAVKLNIKPVTFHLFSLYCLDSKTWLAPNDTVIVKEEKTQRFEFRIRLKLSPQWVRLLPSTDRAALDYLYLQCRTDLITDEHVGQNKQEEDSEQWAKKCIGLGLIDATCALFQANLQPNQFSKKFHVKDFLAPVCVKEYSSAIQKTRLLVNFKENVDKKYAEYKKSSPEGDLAKLKVQFILGGIYAYFPHYLVEEFQIANGEHLRIDPMCDTDSETEAGLYNVDKHELVVSIQDIMEIHILPTGSQVNVQINRKVGMPETLCFTTLEQARSFTSLLERYYRMTADYYFHVCTSVTSPIIKWMGSAKCHGPVSGKWALGKLDEYNKEHEEIVCDYLIKQVNRTTTGLTGQYWNLELVTRKKIFYIQWNYEASAENMWACKCSLMSEGEPTFQNLEKLLGHYSNESNQVLQLKRCLRPSQAKPVENRLLLCQKAAQSHSGSGMSTMPVISRGVPAILQSVTTVAQNIAQGRYTTVHRGVLPAYSGGQTGFVAVKQLKQTQLDLLEYFTRSIHKICFWSDDNIVQIRGICMSGPFLAVEECASLGNIGQYLCEPHETFKVLHIVSAAKQLASALFYLYERDEHHGNVRSRNLFVFNHTDVGMTIKLGDPGMVFLYNNQPLGSSDNTERLPWLAPELYRDLHQMTHSSDMFAFGVTLWELFSSGVRPHDGKSPQEIIDAVQSGFCFEQPPQCPIPVYDVMKKCWNPDPAGRTAARDALRDINAVVTNADDRPYAGLEWESEPQCQEVIDNKLNSAQIKRSNKEFLQRDMPLGIKVPDVNGEASQCDVEGMNEQFTDKGNIQTRPLPVLPMFNDPLLIDEHQLNKHRILGSGYYGQVYLADFINKDGITKQVAVKSLNSEMYEQCAQEFEAEMKIMTKINHNNIVSVIGKCPQRSETEPMLIVMEYVENGCLRDFLSQRKKTVKQSELISFAIDISSGMSYLSAHKIIHNDLAARNVLVTKDVPWRAKISDFGLAKLLKTHQYYYKQVPTKAIPAFWCAPEAIQYKKLSHQSDVWSYGITLWEIYSLGASPHLCKDAAGLLPKLHRGDRLNTSLLDCPEEIRELMKKCWDYKSEKRPPFHEIHDSLCQIRANPNSFRVS